MNHTPETAADYVSHSNLKGLVEWLTAEAILSRPEDPVQFARDLLGQKLVERSKSAGGFSPEEATQWLRATYAKAVAEVDENGVIHGENIPSATTSVAEELANLKIKADGLQTLLRSMGTLSTLDAYNVAQAALPCALSILRCDRVTVYVYDPVMDEMVVHASTVADGSTVRVPLQDLDIPASAISQREIVNLVDAYTDSRFNKDADKAAGYRTKTLLCAPMIAPLGETIGAVMAVNKDNDTFGVADEDLIRNMSNQLAVSIHNAHVFAKSEERRAKSTYTLRVMGELASQLGDQAATYQTVLSKAPSVAGADRVILYFVNESKQMLMEVTADEKVLPHSMERGLLAKAISTDAMVNLKNAYDSPLFNATQDKQANYTTTSLLTAPIRLGGKAVGVMQFLNKIETENGAPFFTAMDEEAAAAFLEAFSHVAVQSALYKRVSGGPEKKKTDGSDSESD